MGIYEKKRKKGYKKPVPDITVSELISCLLHHQGQNVIKVCQGHEGDSYQIIGVKERDGYVFLMIKKN